jgi:hypothetical protein
MTEEDEAFNEIERKAKQRIEAVRATTQAWRESASDYERGFIDGMQKQMQSSVDKAVNAMSQRTEPVASTEKIYKAWDILVGQHKDLLEENKKLRDQSYDLLGQLKVANIKLSYTTPPQRTEQLKACVYCGQLVAKEKNT